MKREGKTHIPKMDNRISTLKRDLAQAQQDPKIDDDPNARNHIRLLENEISYLERKRFKTAYMKSQTHWHHKGEKINKYWCAISNPRKPRDIIYSLRNPATDQIMTRSKGMTEIARKYHNDLQTCDLLPPDNPDRQTAQQTVLDAIPQSQKFSDPNSPVNHLITKNQVTEAIQSAKNGSATGLDGIPYELWKMLHGIHLTNAKLGKPSFDIANALTTVYNNIQTNGTLPNGDFASGWMCPIYKKKDHTKIENYRPNTLLNTDYKLMTRVLTTQLASYAHQLLHPDQTGFIPAHSIFDPIRLAESMCAYTDYMEENRAIIALDQEKAYDKIDHKYLIDTLKTFQLPEIFIRTVASLYDNVNTLVIINGLKSEPYCVTRGVCQGDPLSCLLFNLAIESLATSIWNSPNLSGFNIPGSNSRILINLYADDTTIYLSETDQYDTLQHILTTWCRASGAKFNLSKTEIIPLGTPEHRHNILQT